MSLSLPSTTLPTKDTVNLPKLTGNPSLDVNILRKQSKSTLLKMSQSSVYVMNLCNADPGLNSIITSPNYLN